MANRQGNVNLRFTQVSAPRLKFCLGVASVGPGSYCRPSYIGQQTGENPCGLPLSFPPNDSIGPVRLLRRGIGGPDCRRPQRQTRGLELAAVHETGETPT